MMPFARMCVMGVASAAVLVAGIPSVAQAEERSCRGSLGPITVDNLRVPPGAECILTGTQVKGTITVQRAAKLTARNVRVVGNVQGENASMVRVRSGSRVGGSVQVKQGGAARVIDSRVNGDIQYDQNQRLVRVSRNTVGGSIQVVGNFGGAAVYSNRVDGNLQCKENSPPPVGGGNIVHGNKEDQCAGF